MTHGTWSSTWVRSAGSSSPAQLTEAEAGSAGAPLSSARVPRKSRFPASAINATATTPLTWATRVAVDENASFTCSSSELNVTTDENGRRERVPIFLAQSLQPYRHTHQRERREQLVTRTEERPEGPPAPGLCDEEEEHRNAHRQARREEAAGAARPPEELLQDVATQPRGHVERVENEGRERHRAEGDREREVLLSEHDCEEAAQADAVDGACAFALHLGVRDDHHRGQRDHRDEASISIAP